ncbi:MAG: hypothetical protein ACOX6H_04500 [Christensenellales bacterium]|jgi:hypothetical protein
MGIFKSKQTKQIEKRMLVRKTLNTMNKHIKQLEDQKNIYIEAAKTARKKDLPMQYNLAISGLKMTIAQQKKAYEMLLNFEITSQMKDMSLMTSEFLKGMGVLSKEMAKLTNNKEFEKVQKLFEVAMEGVEMQTEKMDAFLDMNQTTFANHSSDGNRISDEEISTLIDEQAADSEFGDADIDKEIENVRKKLESLNE